MNYPFRHILIEVVGATGSGKTLFQQRIAKVLRDAGFTVGIDWGTDGNPNRSDEMVEKTLESLKSDCVITVGTRTTRRQSLNDAAVPLHDMIAIPKSEYDKLCKDVEWLGCLEAAGVDNWEGFDEARQLRDEQLGEG